MDNHFFLHVVLCHVRPAPRSGFPVAPFWGQNSSKLKFFLRLEKVFEVKTLPCELPRRLGGLTSPTRPSGTAQDASHPRLRPPPNSGYPPPCGRRPLAVACC